MHKSVIRQGLCSGRGVQVIPQLPSYTAERAVYITLGPSMSERAVNDSGDHRRQELWTQLANAVNLRSSQDQVLWTILGFFGATNAVLLSAMFASGDFPKSRWIQGVLVISGLLLSFAWHLIQGRALGHIKRHEALMALIERTLDLPAGMAVSAQINQSLYDIHLGGGIPARYVIARFGWATALLWVFVGGICLANGTGYI